MTLDDSHKSAQVDLPEGVHEDDVEVLLEYLGSTQEPDKNVGFIVLKTAKKKDRAHVRHAQPAAAPTASPDAGQQPVAAAVVETQPASLSEASVGQATVEQSTGTGVSDAAQPATGEQPADAGDDQRGELPAGRDTRRATRSVRHKHEQELGPANNASTEGLPSVPSA